MLHRAWNSKGEMPYCFPRSSIKLQGHTALKIVQFDPNWAFPDCNFSLNSPMAMKCCTELETTKERCPIVFQGHPSNFKVTRDKTSLILSEIGHFRTIGRSQLSNPSDLPCFNKIHHQTSSVKNTTNPIYQLSTVKSFTENKTIQCPVHSELIPNTQIYTNTSCNYWLKYQECNKGVDCISNWELQLTQSTTFIATQTYEYTNRYINGHIHWNTFPSDMIAIRCLIWLTYT